MDSRAEAESINTKILLLYEIEPYRNVTASYLLVVLRREALRRPVKIKVLDPGDR